MDKYELICRIVKNITVFLWIWHLFTIFFCLCYFSFSFILHACLKHVQVQTFCLKSVFYLINLNMTKYDFWQGGMANFWFFLTRGEGGTPISYFWLTSGTGEVWTPPFLADIICEQPLMVKLKGNCTRTWKNFSTKYFMLGENKL